MRGNTKLDNAQKCGVFPIARRRTISATVDTRFRSLIGGRAWASLPRAVQRRFSKRLAGDRTVIYPGTITEARFSRLGWWFAQICRVIGAPLPLHSECGMPAVVSVSEDGKSGGQCWTRIYGRERGFPQVIHSAKRFGGATGLEEYLGRGIGMALQVKAIDGGLEFATDHYFISLFDQRLRIPKWLDPGKTIVRHVDMGGGIFIFSLCLRHSIFGELVFQQGEFRDGQA